MLNDFQTQYRHNAIERDAYNAAFYELGLRWYWDQDTYEQLLRQSENAAEMIRRYLETWQPHLLKAYDAAFLAGAIQQKKAEHVNREATPDAMASRHFDWAQMLDGEVGA